MKIEKKALSQLKVNEQNPRSITKRKLELLVERLLVFPKMIRMRPIVIDKKNVVLGGNMRLRAFQQISGMSIEHIREIVEGTKNWAQWTEAEREQVLQDWQEWLKNPAVDIISADNLSAAEKKEFIIADNASFGDWDYDALANEWDSDDLNSWGIDVWSPEPTTPLRNEGHTAVETEQPEIPSFDCSNLPSELQGQDITPDTLPKIEGTDEVAMERIIIVYPKDKETALAKILGLSHFDKVIYNFDEIMPEE